MSSDSGDRRSVRPPQIPATEHENLVCPRCESTNTKFCYYNNYNLSQPRHFCKSCRRYWTRGGSLRNIPVGGGSRNKPHPNKRPRSSTSTAAIASNSTASASDHVPIDLDYEGSFTSLLATSAASARFVGVPVLDRVVEGGVWPACDLAGDGSDTWQVGSGVAGVVDGGDFFSWPELAISMPGEGLE